MNSEQNNFQQLRRLLALKRHEQPPPGYFHDFSRQVIARIVAGEQADSGGVLDSLSWEAPWLQRLWSLFENKPALAGAFGVLVCGLLISGVIYSETMEPKPIPTVLLPQPAAEKVVERTPVAEPPLFRHAAVVSLPSERGVPVATMPSLFREMGTPKIHLERAQLNVLSPGDGN